MDIIGIITQEFSLKRWQVENTAALIDDGNTIPFIARYRKEAHGTLDDQTLREISERLEYLRNLEKRKEEVFSSIDSQEKMTEEISLALEKAQTLAEIEDIYRPYKPKRRTRASVAREKGLEPLAQMITEQKEDSAEPLVLAADFVNSENGVETPEDALQGAKDIIAEDISDNADIRRRLRNLFTVSGEVISKAADEEKDSVYAQYYDFSQPVSKIAGHRVLAIDRGEREGFLKVSVTLDSVKAANVITSETLLSGNSPCTETVREAGEDAYTRLIYPSVEREIRSSLTEKAAADAIKVFSQNLKELLLQPPVKGKVALGLDPGYRTGCKVAVVDATGRVLDTGVAYITHSERKQQEAKELIASFIKKYGVEIIAIGNGTASKETEIFTASLLKEIGSSAGYMVVSEAGASVYSASKLAAEEFPQYDVSLRSAVSIARRLQDPLAELVKIDPKAIGVGQYQHDMPKKELENALDGVVEDAVNSVGVDLNTASPSLLSRVAGVNSTVAKNIVSYREENGTFTSRTQLKKVNKLGEKAFQQCAGFLRVPESKNILDNTGVHPESYKAAKELLEMCGFKSTGASADLKEIKEKTDRLNKAELSEKLGIGLPTLEDIIKELSRPGRDPRDELPPPMLRSDVMDMSDLKPGMELKGTVRNVIDFGAFVDIGVHQDGLVHISQITNRFIKHPSEVLKVGQVVTVWVLSVDEKKGRIALTMKKPN
ncbi:MAG: Tex family protein [Oscillospiraceae bacterium]|nr:RNA-binding transcriptional accessory protein [Ruminococcus sp.]MDD7338337.1 Tex family protein [Ruminococcus sp.]MDY6062153.1 Tex family protein [Oscillospiraceae bacterium]